MKGVERIHATLTGGPLDRRAVVPVLSLYGARLTGCPLERYYTDPAAYARGQAAVYDTFQPDILFGPFAFASIGAALGSQIRFFSDQAPNIRQPAICSPEEWEKLVLPDPDTDQRLLYFRRAIELMAVEHRGEIAIAASLPAPTDLPALVMGLEGWLETVLFDVTTARRVMDRIIPFWVRLANNCFTDGAAFIVLPSAFASPSVVTREIVSDFTRPVMAEALAQLHGPVVLHSVGAPILAHLDLLTGLPSTVGFALDQRDDLSQGRQVVGPDLVLFGGVESTYLARMTAAQVTCTCLAILEDRREDRHFVLSTTGADVSWSTAPENIHALRKAAESFERGTHDR